MTAGRDTLLDGRVLDGNVLAGPLSEVYDGDVTVVLARCLGCGDLAALAQAVVYLGAGFVVHCRSCDAVMITVVVRAGLPPVVTASGMSGLD